MTPSPASPSGLPARGAISVLIADDDDDVRLAMREVLTAHAGFRVVGDVASGHDLEALAAESRADLVLIDVRMPAGGADAARRLTALSPAPVVVAVSASIDVPTVTALLRAGAAGFLAKGQLGRSFTDDLARLARGQVLIAVPRAAQVLRALADTSGHAH